MRRTLLAVLLFLMVAAAPAPAPASDSIVGGQETTVPWPWMVYLDQGRQEIELGDNQYCGGSLIAPTWVLTAAHCVNDPNLDPLLTTVVVGRRAMSESTSGERIQAMRILVNPHYGDRGDDVALVELERAPADPQPVKLAGPAESGLWAPGAMATILGWGATQEDGSASDVLLEARVPVVADDSCGRAYADPSWGFDADIMVCAGYPEGGTDTCQGDSGGPLAVQAADGSWRQVGVTSFGEGCARGGYPGVYAEVGGPLLRDWIAGYVPSAVGTPPATPAPPAPAAATSPPPAAPASKPAVRKAAKRCRRPKRGASRKAKARYRRCVAKRRRARH